MNRVRLAIGMAPLIAAACASIPSTDTIGTLRHAQVDMTEEKVDGGIEKAMRGYQRFLEQTSDSELTPEAIRRLADLKLEREYGALTPDAASIVGGNPTHDATTRDRSVTDQTPRHDPRSHSGGSESAPDVIDPVATTEPARRPDEGPDDLERAGAREAIALYRRLLEDYPQYDRNDDVLYQMSRAYEELGQIDDAMTVMDRIVREFPRSPVFDEVQFRRAEYFFTRRRYLDAEDAYASIIGVGGGSPFYELALYKLGWTFYKQELYDDALDRFIAFMDHKVSTGYDFDQTSDEQERKRTDDTLRVVSLSFSNLGGPASVVEYFARHGSRQFEDNVYDNLGEFYFEKRRYADAAATYGAFVDRNPFHHIAPRFHMRIIAIHTAGGFPTLVLDAKKRFAATYGLTAAYWQHFDPAGRPEVLAFLKTNVTDLATHYHASYQDPRQADKQAANFEEAEHWYREYLASFPADSESSGIHYRLAELLLERQSYGLAAVEFENTAYGYPLHDVSAQAGYAAIAAYRKEMEVVAPAQTDAVKRATVQSSLRFVDTFPSHEKAAVVLGAAAEDLYRLNAYEEAVAASKKLLENFPHAGDDVVRDTWLVVGHSSYELARYADAEQAYRRVLDTLPEEESSRHAIVDNLAASIYKQGELAVAADDYRGAADHFRRVGQAAPTSTIRPNAEFDAAAALIQLKEWDAAASVLIAVRRNFPESPLQADVTKKIAYVYRESQQLSLAAAEYERIETESQDEAIRRDALLVAAELYGQDGNQARALQVYRRYVQTFPEPIEGNVEARTRIADLLKAQGELESYFGELAEIVTIDAAAGAARTPRTRYLAGHAALQLAERDFGAFVAVKLVQPVDENLAVKRDLMKTATEQFTRLVEYEISDVTAAATYYLAEIFAEFSQALTTSERPDGLSPVEREEYELAIEEQAYPFEEKAIRVHESNLQLMSRGVYNAWIEKSLGRLAVFVPARYDKPESPSDIIGSPEQFVFAVQRPTPVDPPPTTAGESNTGVPADGDEPDSAAGSAGSDDVRDPLGDDSMTHSDHSSTTQGDRVDAVLTGEPQATGR